MKQTSLNFIQAFLFDEEYHKEVTKAILERNHASNLRTTWNGKLEPVPTVLFNNEGNDKTIWVIIRNIGDHELRTAYSLDPDDPEATFDKMPVGTQRAIAIFMKSNDEPIGWRLYQNFIDETSEQVRYGIKTFDNTRKRANALPRDYNK